MDLALSIVKLQGTIDTLIFAVSMIRLASAIAEPPYNTSHRHPAENSCGDGPVSQLKHAQWARCAAVVVSAVLLGLAVFAAIIVQFPPPSNAPIWLNINR